MAKGIVSQIKEEALRVLSGAPQGLRYTELVKAVRTVMPTAQENTVYSAIVNLGAESNDIVRPSRGVWLLRSFADAAAPTETPVPEQTTTAVAIDNQGTAHRYSEADFYAPFAEWLKVDAEEVVESHVLGGSSLGRKWGTPDVIGVYKPMKSDPVNFLIEIVSAEIKIDGTQSITAFGQACAYRLFSHKSYIVMPRTISAEDKGRLESLCSIYGMGFVLFDLDISEPKFVIVVRAQRLVPDMFYANEFASRIREMSKEVFDRLF